MTMAPRATEFCGGRGRGAEAVGAVTVGTVTAGTVTAGVLAAAENHLGVQEAPLAAPW